MRLLSARWTALAAAAAAAAAAAGLAGCGGGADRPATTTRGSSSPAGAAQGASAAVSGRDVFAEACLYCHSLSGHNKPSQQGGDLRVFRGTRQQMAQLTSEMPVLHHPLTHAQLEAVVDYVMAVERGAPG